MTAYDLQNKMDSLQVEFLKELSTYERLPDDWERRFAHYGEPLLDLRKIKAELENAYINTNRELVRKVTEAAEVKNQMSGRKLKPWQEHVITLFYVLILSFLMTGFYSLYTGSAWSWRIGMSLLSVLCIVWLVTVWWHGCKKTEKKP